MSSAKAEQSERRNHERHPFDEITSLTVVTEGGAYPCVVENLSFGGIKLCFEGPVPEVDELNLEHPRAGTFVGRCVWQRGSHMGVQFDLPDRDIERALQCVALMVTPDRTLPGKRPAAARSGLITGKVA